MNGPNKEKDFIKCQAMNKKWSKDVYGLPKSSGQLRPAKLFVPRHYSSSSLNHGQLESCSNGCHAKSKQTLWTNCCTQEVLAHNKLIVNTDLNYNVTRKFKAGNCVILKVRKIAYVSMYSLLPCYSTQGLQLNHVRRNHLCALKPPASELFWNIFSAAHASYHRKRGWAGASCRVHAGARQ